MRVNPPSKIVKGLAEGTLRTTMTHLEKGDVVLVMESSATSINDFRPAPPVAPKRAEWGTVTDVSMNWVTVRLSNGARYPLDYSPQTAVTIKDREIIEPDTTVTVASVFDATPVAESATVATVPACPDCVMPVMPGELHVCPEFMLTARADHLATLSWGTRGRVKRCKSSRPRKLMRGKVAA